MDLEKFERSARAVYPRSIVYSFDDCMRVFKYYFEAYSHFTGNDHPVLTGMQIQSIMKKMPVLVGEAARGACDIEPNEYKSVIDRYFGTFFPDCDYRISHFFSGRIRESKYFEALR